MGVAVTFDLFGTLVAVPPRTEPADAVARALDVRGIAVPDDWSAAYRESHVSAPPGAEIPLPTHVHAALRSRGIEAPSAAVRRAVVDAFDVHVDRRPGARRAIRVARSDGPIGVLSNCSVPGLVPRLLDRSGLEATAFDAVVSSVACGWRKPHARAFEAVATRLGTHVGRLVHVGNDPHADGGIEALGGRAIVLEGEGVRIGDALEGVICRS